MGTEIQDKRSKQLNKGYTIIKFAVLIFIIVGIPTYLYFFQRDFFTQFKDMETVNNFLDQYKMLGGFIYIGGQILQIVIAAIPGQALQIAAGYMYNMGLGYLLSLLGAFIGSIITFYLARWLGKDAMFLMFGQEKMQSFIDRLNGKRAFIIVFILYLIPGIPKDLFNYAAGVSDMKCSTFLIISLAGRSPGMLGSLAIGIMFRTGSYLGIIILGSIAVILFALGAIYHKKVSEWLDNLYEKLVTK